jgi:hypothetical protein
MLISAPCHEVSQDDLLPHLVTIWRKIVNLHPRQKNHPASIGWEAGWPQKPVQVLKRRKKTLTFSGTEQRDPERSDHNIIIIIIQLPQHQPMLTTGCIICFMKPENTQRKKSGLEFPSEKLTVETPY